MEEVKAYKTTDGNIFENQEAVIKHQNIIDIRLKNN